jgi:hypothetical protein
MVKDLKYYTTNLSSRNILPCQATRLGCFLGLLNVDRLIRGIDAEHPHLGCSELVNYTSVGLSVPWSWKNTISMNNESYKNRTLYRTSPRLRWQAKEVSTLRRRRDTKDKERQPKTSTPRGGFWREMAALALPYLGFQEARFTRYSSLVSPKLWR